jgi:TetR/AcrR family transcriptional regulator, tetracycline repressor protein
MTPPRRRREPLTRNAIIAAALDLAEAEGLDKLSLHKVAARVGVKTMSLYNHVADKADLLDAMADHILGAVAIPDVDAMNWPDAVRATSQAVRTAAMAHPHCAPLVLVRRLNAPALLPIVDAVLRTAHRSGLDGATAVHVMRAHIAFLVGSLLREAGTTAHGSMATVVATSEAQLLDAGLPAVAASAGELAFCDHDAEFAFGLELFIASVRTYLEASA